MNNEYFDTYGVWTYDGDVKIAGILNNGWIQGLNDANSAQCLTEVILPVGVKEINNVLGTTGNQDRFMKVYSFPEGLETLSESNIGRIVSGAVFILPSSLTKINCDGLDFNRNHTFYYNGTVEEFNAIEKANRGLYQCWAAVGHMPNQEGTIHCIDGDITVKATDR